MTRSTLAYAAAIVAAGCATPTATAPVPRPPGQAPAPQPPSAPAPADPDEVWEALAPIVVDEPPWTHAVLDGGGRRAVVVPRLTRLMEAPNEITDDDAWLARNGFTRPGNADPVRHVPFFYRGEARLRVIEQPGWTLAVYGSPTAGRYLLASGDADSRRAFDFASFLNAPGARPGETTGWLQDLLWGVVAGSRLYVSHAHLTYAASTGGMNGYVTAVDFETGDILWRSRPLVANARTFEVVDDALVAGYGFTAEPDALFVIDRYTGEVLSEAQVRTAPTWILRRDERLFVRAYDADYVYAIR